MRNSKQKKIIQKAIAQLHFDHPTAADIYDLARESDEHISLGTVYRNLGELVDRGELKRLSMPDGPDRFDPQTFEHYHVSCNKCHRVFDIDVELTRRLVGPIQAETGVKVDNLQLVGTGVCHECSCNNIKEELCLS